MLKWKFETTLSTFAGTEFGLVAQIEFTFMSLKFFEGYMQQLILAIFHYRNWLDLNKKNFHSCLPGTFFT